MFGTLFRPIYFGNCGGAGNRTRDLIASWKEADYGDKAEIRSTSGFQASINNKAKVKMNAIGEEIPFQRRVRREGTDISENDLILKAVDSL